LSQTWEDFKVRWVADPPPVQTCACPAREADACFNMRYGRMDEDWYPEGEVCECYCHDEWTDWRTGDDDEDEL
jgi:hypothetical protein